MTQHSPNCRDGAFLNLEPRSNTDLNREQLTLIAWDLVGHAVGVGRPT
ncbi:hypothetical protein [Mycobacterium tilburgii]|nr:hypothetical protein [Mycobacterium tilburgii]